MIDKNFYWNINDEAADFVMRLKKKDSFSHFPLSKGLTRNGNLLSLGFTCYALKIFYMTGKWDNLSDSEKNGYVNFVNSFQTHTSFPKNYFLDNELYKSYKNLSSTTFKYLLKDTLNKTGKFNFSSKQQDLEKALNADNKQAISTLYEIGYNNKIKIENKYSDNDAVLNYLNSLNWKRPWDAGAQFSSICVYSETQNFNFTEILEPFILTKLNIETGSYHDSGLKNTREIINGAMKVISGLDWLGVQIHDPKKLIDFCIDNKPHIEGCDVVDYVYVLYKCIKQDNHRRKEVQVLFLELLEEIMKLYNHSDKGFSYFENKSQTHYYGVKISKGLDVADLHGTTLCIWAINMILESLDVSNEDLKVIKP